METRSPITYDREDILMEFTIKVWELMVKKHPESFELGDLETDGEILQASGGMYQDNSVLSRTPNASRNYKLKEIVSCIYQQYKYGSGLRTGFGRKTVDQLLDRPDLCNAAYRA